MSENSHKDDNFSILPVPEENTVAGWQIALVITGGTIAVPGFIMAGEIATQRGFGGALPAFILGAIILGAIGIMTGLVGRKRRLSTYMLAKDAFGTVGAALVAITVATASFGWFAVLAGVFGEALQQIFIDLFEMNLPRSGFIVFGTILFMGVTFFGFKAIDRFAVIIVPCMLSLLLFTAWKSLESSSIQELINDKKDELSLGIAISAVVGTYIIGAITNPDYTRYAKTAKDAIFVSIIGLSIAFPTVLILAAVPSVVMGETDLIKLMVAIGIGIPALLMLLLSTWSSNALVLYSASLSAASIISWLSYRQIVLMFGVMGTIVAIIGIMDFFIPFLVVLGTAIPPIGAIYVIHAQMLDQGADKTPTKISVAALTAWGTGFAAGLLSSFGFLVLTYTPSLDSMITTAAVYIAFLKISNLKRDG